MLHNSHLKEKGFTIIESLVAVILLSIVILAATGFVFWFTYYNNKLKSERELLENSRNVMQGILYEIERAESIYTPTSSLNQLSLATYDYLPADEIKTFIDFFLCDSSRICFKKESQSPVFLTPDTVYVESLQFTQISTNGANSVKINLSARYNTNDPSQNFTVSLSSTGSLRSY
ncbi:MAG: type II secretion system protein [bacterium]